MRVRAFVELSAGRRGLPCGRGRSARTAGPSDEVASLFKVSKSWVYEHTRGRGGPRTERLPHVKIGKYVRFEVQAVRRTWKRNAGSCDSVRPPRTIVDEPNHEGPTRERVSRMAQRKRQYGSGCLLKRGRGWAIRWRELEIAPMASTRRALRYETLGEVSRRDASEALARRLAAAGGKHPTRSQVTFRTLASEWEATVLPMYKHSTQKHRRFMLKKHLLPRFGDKALWRDHAAGHPGVRRHAHAGRVRAPGPSITCTMC